MMVTAKQMRLVQVVKRQLSEDVYRFLLGEAGVESARDLDDVTLDIFITEAKKLGFKNTSQQTFGSRRGMATPQQVALIRKLWAEWSRADATEKELNAWLERSFHISALRFLSSEGADKAINGLRAMIRRKAEVADHDNWSA